MRFLFAPAIVAALTAAATLPPSSSSLPSPRPLVIIVHGRGHLGEDSTALRREWKRDLDSAFTSVGLPTLANEDVRLAWFADMLDPGFDGPNPCVIPSGETDSLGLESFARDFLGSLASALPRDESRDARSLFGDLLYALDESRRCAAERRVGGVIEAAAMEHRPVVVVAYSLGSVVAYGYLSSRASFAKWPTDLRLVTIGSPLGNRELRELLGQSGDSLRRPAGVSAWENVYDPDDLFAAPLEENAAHGVRDRVTQSTADDAHHIRHYLRDRATAAAIGRALCATSARQFGEVCGRL